MIAEYENVPNAIILANVNFFKAITRRQLLEDIEIKNTDTLHLDISLYSPFFYLLFLH